MIRTVVQQIARFAQTIDCTAGTPKSLVLADIHLRHAYISAYTWGFLQNRSCEVLRVDYYYS